MELPVRPSSYWWGRAEEARGQLAQMINRDAREATQLVIENYERIAKITEAHEARMAAKGKSGAEEP